MSRKLKRVPMNFSWPLNKVWGGFVNPYYQQSAACPDCENGYDRTGGRPDANAALFHDQWYGKVTFDPAAYGAEPISPTDPQILDLARRNVGAAPDFYQTPDEALKRLKFRQAAMDGFPGDDRPLIPFPAFDTETAITREVKRLYTQCFRRHWCHHLIQADVNALDAAGRLWDFTHRPRTPAQQQQLKDQEARGGSGYWLEEPNGHHPTAAEVNAWSRGPGFGHDSLNAGVCIRERCAREGVPYECARCGGSSRVWPSPEIKKRYDEWTDEEPPIGDGYQLWEDCSEGSPTSPVFATLDDLCAWAADNETTFGDYKASKEEWRKMLEDDFVHATDDKGHIFL